MDSDMVMAPNTITTMVKIMRFWEGQDFYLSMLGTLLIEAKMWRHISSRDHLLLYRDGDLGLSMVRSSLLKTHRKWIKGARRWETGTFRNKCAQDGYPCGASIKPRIIAAHLGLHNPMIPTEGNYTNRKPWGNGEPMNPFPEFLDYDSFQSEYPYSAVKLGNDLRSRLPDGIRTKVERADLRANINH
jgi:hypothetical protein